MLFKLSNMNSNLSLTRGYLNPALNNSALVDSLNNRGQMVQLRENLGRAPKEPSSPSSVSTQSLEITFTGSFHENNKRVALTMDNFFVAYTGKDGRDGIHGRVEYCFYSSCSGK